MVYDIQSLLMQWETAGIFDYVLPFLLIFAIIFGILSATKISGSNKGVHLIIALSIALMALRFGLVQEFFADTFPKLGVGLAFILVLMILIGLFIAKEDQRYWFYGLGAVGALVGLVILYSSLNNLRYFDTILWQENLSWFIGIIAVIGIIVAVAASGGDKTRKDGSGKFGNLRESD